MRLNKQLRGKLLATGLIIGSLFSATAPIVNADQSEVQALDGNQKLEVQMINEDNLNAYFKEHNVPEDKQLILLEKLENGIAWDCDNPAILKNMPQDMNELDLANGETEKYFRFEDGSFVKIAFESIDSNNSRAIQTDSFGTLYTNHKVSRIVGSLKASYIINAYIPKSGAGRIYTMENSDKMYNDPYGADVNGFGLQNDPQLKVVRDIENTTSKQAALVDLAWRVSSTVSAGWNGNGVSIPVGGTAHLYTAIRSGKMYVSPTLPF